MLTRRSSSSLAVAIACLTLLTACDRRTPEERLQKAFEFVQQQDTMSAEVEAQKIIEKTPDDPAAVHAGMLLAQIYMREQRPDEALLVLEEALQKVNQLDPVGKQVLQAYLQVLQSQDKFDEALQTIDKYQKEYAADAGTSLSLRVARADVQIKAGQTTPARELLSELVGESTSPAELAIYRDLTVTTYLVDRDTTAAAKYLESELARAIRPEDKTSIASGLAAIYAQLENYEKTREYLAQVTRMFEQMVAKELDRRVRVQMSLELSQNYVVSSNLPGARRILQTVYDSGLSEPELVGPTVAGLSDLLLRLGETSATVDFLHEAAKRYPNAPFVQQIPQLDSLAASGQLAQAAPMDTSTLTLKFKEDPQVLWPEVLTSLLGSDDSGSTGSVSTTATAVAAPLATDVAATTAIAPAASETAPAPAEPIAVEATAPSAEPESTQAETQATPAEVQPTPAELPAQTETFTNETSPTE